MARPFRHSYGKAWAQYPRAKRKSRYHHLYCTRDKAVWIRAELAAHIELTQRGHTAQYKRLERASDRAFAKAHQAGCAWTRRAR